MQVKDENCKTGTCKRKRKNLSEREGKHISERRGFWRQKREKYIGKVRAREREREVNGMTAKRKSEEHRKT